MVNAPSLSSGQEDTAVLKGIIKSLTDGLSTTNPKIRLYALEACKDLIAQNELINALDLLGEFHCVIECVEKTMSEAWDDPEIKAKFLYRACGLFMAFSAYDEVGVSMLTGGEGTLLPPLLDLLNHSNKKVQTSAVILIFTMFYKGSDAHMQKILDAGFITKIPGLLDAETNRDTKEYTMSCIYYIFSDGSQAQFETMMEPEVLSTYLPLAVNHFEDETEPVLKLAASILLVNVWTSAVRRGFTEEDLAEKLSPYGLTETLMIRADCFRIRRERIIIMGKFAQAGLLG